MSALVTIKYEDLASGKDVTEEIFRAYGPDGLGALTVSGIPGYAESRERLLPMAYKLAHLPEVWMACSRSASRCPDARARCDRTGSPDVV